MAAVPEYQRRLQLRPANQQEVRVSTSANTFGGQVGAALQTAGQGAFDAAAAIDYKDQLTADAEAREAFSAYRYDQREAMRAPETGFLNQTGGNAVGIQTTAEERLRGLRDTHGEGLSPRALQRYGEMVDGLQDQAHASILGHASGETRNYVVNQRTSTIEGYVEEAATNWDNPELFERNLELAVAEQGELAGLQGWDPATRERSNETLISGAYRQRIVLAASDDPIAAQAILEASRDFLTAEDEHALDTGLEDLVREAQASNFTQQFIRRGQPIVGGVAGGDRSNARFDAQDRPDDGVEVAFAMGPARPNRPNQEVVDVVATAAEATFGAGTRVVVTSGAENDGHQHGSDRHLTGMAADIAIYRPDGTQVRATDADAAQFARAAAMSGALGLGFGEGYMGGDHFHVDLVVPGGGQAHTWGRQGAAMRPELTALMDRGAALALESTPYENSPMHRGLVSQFGIDVATTMIGAAENTPYISAEVALPPEVLAANPSFAGMTIGEVYDTVATAIGDDPAARTGRAHFDAQAAYEAALAIEDPALRAEVLRSIDTMATLQDRARTEGRRGAQEEAWNEYVATGRTDFPIAMRQAMGQSGWTSFQQAVRNDQQGIDRTDPDTWELLTRMASSNPQAFADLNLTAHYANLSRSDRERFIVTQETVRAELQGRQLEVAEGRNTIDFDTAYRAADEVYRAMVEETAPAQMNQEQRLRRMQFQQQLTSMVQDFYDRESRDPNTREVREMAATLALPIEYYRPNAGFVGGGFDGVNELGSGQLFEAANRESDVRYRVEVSYDDIPIADRTRIAAQLMQANGGTMPVEGDIVEAYEQQQLISAGLPPNVEIGAVPEWLIEIERSGNPDITDDELVELYQLFLLSQ